MTKEIITNVDVYLRELQHTEMSNDVDSKLADVERKISRLIEVIEVGCAGDSIEERLSKLEHEKVQLKNQLFFANSDRASNLSASYQQTISKLISKEVEGVGWSAH